MLFRLAVVLLLISDVLSGPVKTSLCCCGCIKEPCPSVGPTCGSPQQSCESHIDADVVRCDELQRLWELAEHKKSNESISEEDAASPGFTPFISESGVPFAIHDKALNIPKDTVHSVNEPGFPLDPKMFPAALRELFAEKKITPNDSSSFEIRFSPPKREQVSFNKLTMKRLDGMLTELEEMIGMVKGLMAAEVIEQQEDHDMVSASETPVSSSGIEEVTLPTQLSSTTVIVIDPETTTTTTTTSTTKAATVTSQLSTSSSTIEELTTTSPIVEEKLDLSDGALPDEEETRAIDEVIRRMKQSIVKLATGEPSSPIDSLFQLDSSVVAQQRAQKKDLRPKRAAKDNEKSENCNDPKLKKIITDNISSDAKSSKRAIQKAAEKEFGGTFNVICSPCEFSFVVSSQKFCEGYKDQVACFVFLQPPTNLKIN